MRVEMEVEMKRETRGGGSERETKWPVERSENNHNRNI